MIGFKLCWQVCENLKPVKLFGTRGVGIKWPLNR